MKKELGVLLQKKWKNIRDSYSKDIQRRKIKTCSGVSTKAPYIYSRQLQFFNDTLEPKESTSSLEVPSVPVTVEEQVNEARSYVATGSLTPTTPQPSYLIIGKKRLHPVEKKLISSLNTIQKRASTETTEDYNRHFLLSLLKSLPKMMNSQCRIEIMQIINKF